MSWYPKILFTVRCTIMQSAVLRSHVICPSVCDVGGSGQDHIGWKSWKLIAQTISPTSLLFISQRSSTYSHGEHGEILERLEVGWGKVACWSTKAAISLKRVKIEGKLLWRAYRKSPMLFQMVPFAIPYDLLLLSIRVHNPQPKLQSLLSQEWLRLRISNFLCIFIESIRTKVHQNNLGKVSIGIVR